MIPKLTEAYCRRNACAKQYNVGDEVMLHPDLKTIPIGVGVTPYMSVNRGKIAHINSVSMGSYRITLDGDINEEPYNWQDYMFVPVDKGPTLEEFGEYL